MLFLVIALIFVEFLGLVAVSYFAYEKAKENVDLRTKIANLPSLAFEPQESLLVNDPAPEIVKRRRKLYVRLSKRRGQAVGAFLHECCEIGLTDDFVSSGHLYNRYLAWGKVKELDNDLLMGINGFSYHVAQHGAMLQRKYTNGRQRRCVIGVRLRADAIA